MEELISSLDQIDLGHKFSLKPDGPVYIIVDFDGSQTVIAKSKDGQEVRLHKDGQLLAKIRWHQLNSTT
jgi:hypothetical protein